MDIKPFPLTWPLGYPRTDKPRSSQFQVTLAAARDGILEQLRLWGATQVVISSDAPVKLDGMPYASGPRGSHDPGVCVYFTRKKENWSLPCDEYGSIRENMQALRHIIEALRAIERHGGIQALRSASSKFMALPEAGAGTGAKWWDILEISYGATKSEIDEAWRIQVKKVHPDKGGSPEKLQAVQEAYAQAMASFKS